MDKESEMLSLQWPWLLTLLPLPFLVYFFVPKKDIKVSEVYAPSLMILADAKPNQQQKSSWIIILLTTIAWCCLIVAASRPIFVGQPKSVTNSDRNMMLAVDISQSMLEEDMVFKGRQINRLQAVKAVLTRFIERRQGDRLGLILFGERAYVQTPLTFDLGTLQQLLDEAVVGLAGRKTAIGDGIGLAVKRLQDLPESNRVLILLTDGQNTAGEIEPLQASKLAAQAGVKVYTIGIGADEMIVRELFGTRRVNPSRDLDEDTLTTIAEDTGGKYYRARNPEDLESIYNILDQLEEIEVEDQVIRPEKSLFHIPLGFSLLFAALLFLINLDFSLSRLIKKPLSKGKNKEHNNV
ncbi:MAG: Ca-activated chloride channel family protein [Crocinitomicaceae bacterium]|jgi:Ca-activated chloride channel family protein